MNYYYTMLRYLPLLLLLFASCASDDNYDLTQEIEGPREPVIVDDDRPYAIFTTGDSTEIEYGGYALTNSSGFTMLTTTAAVTSSCDATSIGYSFRGRGAPTAMFFTINPDGSVRDLHVQISRFHDGGTFTGAGESSPPCESVPTVFEITSLTDTFIAGRITAEFFGVDSRLPAQSDCSRFISYGIRTIEFAVPLRKC